MNQILPNDEEKMIRALTADQLVTLKSSVATKSWITLFGNIFKQRFVLFYCNSFVQAFTPEYDVYWGQHPLRPEFVESTYFLYKVKFYGLCFQSLKNSSILCPHLQALKVEQSKKKEKSRNWSQMLNFWLNVLKAFRVVF